MKGRRPGGGWWGGLEKPLEVRTPLCSSSLNPDLVMGGVSLVAPDNIRGSGLIPGLGRSPGGGNGNLFQYSCRKNPTDRGAWQATVHGVTKSQTQVNTLSYTQPVPTAFSVAFDASYKMLSPIPKEFKLKLFNSDYSHV